MSVNGDDVLDPLREIEEKNFVGLKEYLGESFELFYDLIELYGQFLSLSQKSIFKLGDEHQIPALLHSMQWLRHEGIVGALTMLRGHVADSSNYTRRAIEICAFITLMFKDKDAAARWMKAGTSKRAQAKYMSAFPAWKLVKDQLTPELISLYEQHCLNVHPSFFSVAKRASLDEDRTHRFSFFDLEEDGDQTYLVMQFFLLLLCHARVMEFLTTVFFPFGHFDEKAWLSVYLPFTEKWKDQRDKNWRAAIDSRMEQYVDDNEK